MKNGKQQPAKVAGGRLVAKYRGWLLIAIGVSLLTILLLAVGALARPTNDQLAPDLQIKSVGKNTLIVSLRSTPNTGYVLADIQYVASPKDINCTATDFKDGYQTGRTYDIESRVTHTVCFRARYRDIGTWGYDNIVGTWGYVKMLIKFESQKAAHTTSNAWQQMSTLQKRNANPQNCNLQTQYIRGFDGICLNKNYSTTSPSNSGLHGNLVKNDIFIDTQIREVTRPNINPPPIDGALQVKGVLIEEVRYQAIKADGGTCTASQAAFKAGKPTSAPEPINNYWEAYDHLNRQVRISSGVYGSIPNTYNICFLIKTTNDGILAVETQKSSQAYKNWHKLSWPTKVAFNPAGCNFDIEYIRAEDGGCIKQNDPYLRDHDLVLGSKIWFRINIYSIYAEANDNPEQLNIFVGGLGLVENIRRLAVKEAKDCKLHLLSAAMTATSEELANSLHYSTFKLKADEPAINCLFIRYKVNKAGDTYTALVKYKVVVPQTKPGSPIVVATSELSPTGLVVVSIRVQTTEDTRLSHVGWFRTDGVCNENISLTSHHLARKTVFSAHAGFYDMPLICIVAYDVNGNRSYTLYRVPTPDQHQD